MRELVYENGWSDYEEGHGIEILQEGDRLFFRDTGNNVYSGEWNEEREITWEEAMGIIEEWENLDHCHGDDPIM